MKNLVVAALTTGLLSSITSLSAAELGDPENIALGVAAASEEGVRAMRGFSIPDGMEVEQIAAEPDLANPVAFSIDEKGRIYVVETFRHGAGVLDIRGRDNWPNAAFKGAASRERLEALRDEMLDVDLGSLTVDDRIAYLKKYFGEDVDSLGQASERVKRLVDTDGDGIIDESGVFADGFNNIADGLASGVLAWRGDVWFTNIPELWWFSDRDEDGVPEQQRSLHYGYGNRSGFLGHDSHGLEFGPDGKLYFTIGDRGAHIRLPNGLTLDNPDSGAVFRCNPDGSELELFATGLRNPQELTFDTRGNLFTGDNNSDGGDQARWVQLVEGGDTGWRIGYQFLEGSSSPYYDGARGPWNAEKMWHERNPDQPAFLIPSISIIGNGPSGVTHYPGTGLGDSFHGTFFMVDFKGQPNLSGIHSFRLQPNGATFKLIERTNFIWGLQATDVDFGVNGGIYTSDWVQGWNKNGKGRIYRVFNPGLEDSEPIESTRAFLAQSLRNHSVRELRRFLDHADYRVRLDAQFELARRGDAAIDALTRSARDTQLTRGQIHGVWGLGQILNQFRNGYSAFELRSAMAETLIALLNDPRAEIRAQAARVLGDAAVANARQPLTSRLTDVDAMVRYHAANALGKLADPSSVPALIELLRRNDNSDPIVRHGAVMSLTRLNDVPSLSAAANDASAAVRLGAVLALRRLQREEIGRFLNDSDINVVREAARAINDAPVNGAMIHLAEHEPADWNDTVIAARVMNANFRLGTAEAAARLVAAANSEAAPQAVRVDALNALANWPDPSVRDRVVGTFRPLINSTRDRHAPATALQSSIANVLQSESAEVQLAAIDAVVALELRSANEILVNLVNNEDADERVRSEALSALAELRAPRLEEALAAVATSDNERLRGTAQRIQAALKGITVESLEETLASGGVREKQQAFSLLATLGTPETDRLLARWVGELAAGEVAPELQLDVILAAEARESRMINRALERYRESLDTNDELAEWRPVLFGGDSEAGRKIFYEREDVACLRCHQLDGLGGEVGPKLDGIASRLNREQLLESIVMPNKTIAAGFENVLVQVENGTWYSGLIDSENDSTLVLNSPEDGFITIDKADIKDRQRGASGMPEGLALILGKKGTRDIVNFMAEQK